TGAQGDVRRRSGNARYAPDLRPYPARPDGARPAARGGRRRSMRLVHLSDLHFGHHDDAVVETLAADIRARAPDLVVVSGDFTQIGSRREFEIARAFLDTLPAPLFAVPGNHDVPERNLIKRF